MAEVRRLLRGRLLRARLRLGGIGLALVLEPIGRRAGALIGTAEGLVEIDVGADRWIELQRGAEQLG